MKQNEKPVEYITRMQGPLWRDSQWSFRDNVATKIKNINEL